LEEAGIKKGCPRKKVRTKEEVSMKKVRLAVFGFLSAHVSLPALYAASENLSGGFLCRYHKPEERIFKDNRYNEFFDFLNSLKIR
jgi:hypothetical protein